MRDGRVVSWACIGAVARKGTRDRGTVRGRGGGRSPLGQAIGEVAVSDTRRKCRRCGGAMEDEERREGVGVLKEECHLSLRRALQNMPRPSTYGMAKDSIRLEVLILEFSSR